MSNQLNIIGNKTCFYCDIIQSIFDVFEYPFNYMLDNDHKYQKYPAIFYNQEIIDYESLNDIFNKINIKEISISNLYDKIMKLIYSIDETDLKSIFKIINILKVKEIKYYNKKGYLLSHHIIESSNKKLIDSFIFNNLGAFDDLITSNYIFNTDGMKIVIPGGQTILHISSNNKELYKKIKNICNDSQDILGNYAKDYYENHNNLDFYTKVKNRMLNLYSVNYDINNFIIDQYHDSDLKIEILNIIKNNEIIKPNSMHKCGHVLNDLQCIKKLVYKLNDIYNLKLTDKVYEISAFTAEYGINSNNNLDLHKDNSIITINWNLEIDSDIRGTEIVFPSINQKVEFKNSTLIIHHGKIEHYVEPLLSGSRTNLIIWIK